MRVITTNLTIGNQYRIRMPSFDPYPNPVKLELQEWRTGVFLGVINNLMIFEIPTKWGNIKTTFTFQEIGSEVFKIEEVV